MSKRFKGKACAYCSTRLSETGDHVFARAFFPRSQWAELPQVPACRICNQRKSSLENYLATVLLFGGRHADAERNLNDMGARRLGKNAALHRQLIQGKDRVWLRNDSGVLVQSTSLPLDDAKFTAFFDYVVRGLLRYEFGETLGADDFVDINTVTRTGGEPIFRRYLSLNAAARTARDVGNGAFAYEGSQASDNGHVSVWLLSAFGGLLFQDEEGRTYETRIGALTGPRRVAAKVATRQRWLNGLGPIAG